MRQPHKETTLLLILVPIAVIVIICLAVVIVRNIESSKEIESELIREGDEDGEHDTSSNKADNGTPKTGSAEAEQRDREAESKEGRIPANLTSAELVANATSTRLPEYREVTIQELFDAAYTNGVFEGTEVVKGKPLTEYYVTYTANYNIDMATEDMLVRGRTGKDGRSKAKDYTIVIQLKTLNGVTYDIEAVEINMMPVERSRIIEELRPVYTTLTGKETPKVKEYPGVTDRRWVNEDSGNELKCMGGELTLTLNGAEVYKTYNYTVLPGVIRILKGSGQVEESLVYSVDTDGMRMVVTIGETAYTMVARPLVSVESESEGQEEKAAEEEPKKAAKKAKSKKAKAQ